MRVGAVLIKNYANLLTNQKKFHVFFSKISSYGAIGGPVEKMWFFKWPQSHFWVIKTTLLGTNMISWKFRWKILTRTYPLSGPNIGMFRTNKMALFTCYLSHICISWKRCIWIMFKCFKLLLYMFITRVQSLGTRFRHQVGHRGYYKGGGHR